MTTQHAFTFNAFTIRQAVPGDVPEISSFIKGLAEYAHLLDEFAATEEELEKWLFHEKKAEVILGEADGRPVGFALFFTSFSTFQSKPGIYLEDLFIRPYARGNGFGKKMFAYLAKLVAERNYARLEWACLDWNEPNINFYLSLGAEPLNESTTYRLMGASLEQLAAETAG